MVQATIASQARWSPMYSLLYVLFCFIPSALVVKEDRLKMKIQNSEFHTSLNLVCNGVNLLPYQASETRRQRVGGAGTCAHAINQRVRGETEMEHRTRFQ